VTPRSPFRRLLEYARPHRGRLLAAMVAMVVYGAANTFVVLQLRPIVDKVLKEGQEVAPTIALILAFYFLKGIGAYLSDYLMTGVGQRVVRDLRNELFGHILGQSAAFFSMQAVGRLTSRITNDVAQVQRAVSDTLGDLARESLALIGLTYILFRFDARLALVCFTGAPLVVYPLVTLGRRVRRTTHRSQEALEQLSHTAAEAFAGHRIVKAFGSESRELAKFQRTSEHLFRTNMKVTSTLSALPPMMEFVGGLAFAGALWYGSQEISGDRMTVGEFMTFMTSLFLMYAPAKKLSRVNAELQQARAAAERIFEMLDTHTEVHERPEASAFRPLQRELEFRDVSFTYAGAQKPTLDGISVTARAGEVVALVGKSGAGKTTAVNLIPRFYDVTGGAILIDGRDIRDASLASLRGQIAIVTQETVLFDDTVAANIAYGRPSATRAEIESAARAAHAHEFIVTDLPNGYDTLIGERGQRLSGGQRQRLAIARAILREAPILILDEATAALDAESEMLVQDALANLMLNRTSFVIAHRLSTVRRADLILVLDGGRIADRGTHPELLGRGGLYAKLYEQQFRDEPGDAPAPGPETPV
jgi:ATP-binding cassette, subfamily B, bacterial MsbA